MTEEDTDSRHAQSSPTRYHCESSDMPVPDERQSLASRMSLHPAGKMPCTIPNNVAKSHWQLAAYNTYLDTYLHVRGDIASLFYPSFPPALRSRTGGEPSRQDWAQDDGKKMLLQRRQCSAATGLICPPIAACRGIIMGIDDYTRLFPIHHPSLSCRPILKVKTNMYVHAHMHTYVFTYLPTPQG